MSQLFSCYLVVYSIRLLHRKCLFLCNFSRTRRKALNNIHSYRMAFSVCDSSFQTNVCSRRKFNFKCEKNSTHFHHMLYFNREIITAQQRRSIYTILWKCQSFSCLVQCTMILLCVCVFFCHSISIYCVDNDVEYISFHFHSLGFYLHFSTRKTTMRN